MSCDGGPTVIRYWCGSAAFLDTAGSTACLGGTGGGFLRAGGGFSKNWTRLLTSPLLPLAGFRRVGTSYCEEVELSVFCITILFDGYESPLFKLDLALYLSHSQNIYWLLHARGGV